MVIQHLAQIPAETVALPGMSGVATQGILMEDEHLPGFLVRMFILDPRGHTGLHQHPQQHLHYFTRGRGDFVSDGGRREAVAVGDIVLTEPNEFHQITNTGI